MRTGALLSGADGRRHPRRVRRAHGRSRRGPYPPPTPHPERGWGASLAGALARNVPRLGQECAVSPRPAVQLFAIEQLRSVCAAVLQEALDCALPTRLAHARGEVAISPELLEGARERLR